MSLIKVKKLFLKSVHCGPLLRPGDQCFPKTDTHMGDEIPRSRAEKDGLKFVCILFHGKCHQWQMLPFAGG